MTVRNRLTTALTLTACLATSGCYTTNARHADEFPQPDPDFGIIASIIPVQSAPLAMNAWEFEVALDSGDRAQVVQLNSYHLSAGDRVVVLADEVIPRPTG